MPSIHCQRAARSDQCQAPRISGRSAVSTVTGVVPSRVADDGLVNGLAALALMHPLMGAEGRRQIEWSLRTQQEVITAPIEGLRRFELPSSTPSTRRAGATSVAPWVIEAEGIRS